MGIRPEFQSGALPKMQLSDAIIWCRRLSVLFLVVTVAYGTAFVDHRFTVLFVPPFIMYWAHYEDFMQLPIMRLLSLPFNSDSWRSRLSLAAAGGIIGIAVNYLIGLR